LSFVCEYTLDSALPFLHPNTRHSLLTAHATPPTGAVFTMVLIENQEYLCEEEKRLKQDKERTAYWKKWGSYVAERQWATGQSLLFSTL
jgi:hypothetical protein